MTIRVVRDAKDGPITLFKRGPAGEIQVHLNTEKTYWSAVRLPVRARDDAHLLQLPPRR